MSKYFGILTPKMVFKLYEMDPMTTLNAEAKPPFFTWYENCEKVPSFSTSEIGENSEGGSTSSGGVNSTDSSVNSMSKYRVSVSLIT